MPELFDVLTYDYEKTVDVLNIPETYTPVGTLTTPLRAAGTYVLGFSLTYNFDRTTESVFFRWRQNGGAWTEYSSEPKDITDSLNAFYEFPADYTEISHTIEVQMRKETVNGTLDLKFLDIFFQRVG